MKSVLKGVRDFIPDKRFMSPCVKQGLINFARVGTAVHCLLRPFPKFYSHVCCLERRLHSAGQSGFVGEIMLLIFAAIDVISTALSNNDLPIFFSSSTVSSLPLSKNRFLSTLIIFFLVCSGSNATTKSI